MDCSKKGLTSHERFDSAIMSRAEPMTAPRLREQRRPPSPPDGLPPRRGGRSSPLPQQPAGVPLTHPVLVLGTLHRTTPPLRAYKFPCATSRSTCFSSSQAASTVFSQLFPFVALTRFWGVCFRSQRLRLARLRGEFSDGFLTVVAATAML